MSALSITPTSEADICSRHFPIDMNTVVREAVISPKRWCVEFEVDAAPHVVTVKASTKYLAIEYAEGVLWLQLGKPHPDSFSPWCTSCVEVSA